MNKKAYGFTLTELLIVIIVIGILATIGIIAYRGIQERAKSVALVAGIDQWEKAIAIASIQGIRLPSNTHTCLGRADDFPAADGFDEGVCLEGSNGETVEYDGAAFSTWGEEPPSGKMPVTTLTTGGVTYRSRGIWVHSSGSEYINLMWVPQVSGVCGRGAVALESENGLLAGGLCVVTVTY